MTWRDNSELAICDIGNNITLIRTGFDSEGNISIPFKLMKK